MLKKLNSYINVSMIVSLLFGVLGLILMFYPSSSFEVISYIIAGSLIINGIFLFVIDYKTQSIFVGNFLYAILSLIAGILIFSHPGTMQVFIPVCLGIWFLISGLLKLKLSIYIKNESTFYHILSLLTTIITIVCGVILLVNPVGSADAITASMGILLLIYSVSDLIDMIVAKKYMNNIAKYIKEEFRKFKEID